MSTTTVNYGLTKPANGEFVDTWDVPVNGNWDLIDSEMKLIQTELDDHQVLATDPHGTTLTQTTLNIDRGASESGNAIDIVNPTSNKDIDGNASSWSVDNAGNAVFNTVVVNPGAPLNSLVFSRKEMLGSDGTGLGNREFAITNPYTIGNSSLSVYVDGILQIEGISRDYQEVTNTSILFNADVNGSAKVTFFVGQKTSSSFGNVDIFDAAGGESVIPLSFNYIIGADQVDVFKNGALLVNFDDYNETAINQITMITPLSVSDRVVIRQARDPLATGHSVRHEAGGSDEINLTNMSVGAPGEGIILISPAGDEYLVTVNNAGSLIATLI